MIVEWLPAAHTNLRDAVAYIAGGNPSAALDVLDEIEAQSGGLSDFPELGRPGRVDGTRELVVNRTPFILVYRVLKNEELVQILRLLHGAQQWPEA